MAFLNIEITNPNWAALDPKQPLTALHQHSEEIAALLRVAIRGRTPRDTGALKESISSKAYPNRTTTPPLVDFYADSAPQLAEWRRVYVDYQEGPPIGLSTYTNPPRQMFLRVTTDDVPTIYAWAELTVNNELSVMVDFANAGATTTTA